jgi:hypothetical protein
METFIFIIIIVQAVVQQAVTMLIQAKSVKLAPLSA